MAVIAIYAACCWNDRSRRPASCGCTPTDAADLFDTTLGAIERLVEEKELTSCEIGWPVQRRSINVIEAGSLRRFRRQYTSLVEGAKSSGCAPGPLALALEAQSVVPAIHFGHLRASRFYLLTDTP